MNNRGQGRVFQRGAYLWVAYYAHGKEEREAARHVRTGDKLEASEKNRHEAERFLKRRLGELAAEQHGGRAFVGPQQERITVNQLLDGLESDYKLRSKWSVKTASNVKPLRDYFGTWRAVELSTAVITNYIESLRAEGYSNATANRRTQLLGQAFKVAMRNNATSRFRSNPSFLGFPKSAMKGRAFSRLPTLKPSCLICRNIFATSAVLVFSPDGGKAPLNRCAGLTLART